MRPRRGAVGLAVLVACGGEPADPLSGETEHGAPAAAPEAGLRFLDVTTASGLGGFRQENGDGEKLYVVESVGAGVALFDYDGDGDLDAYLTNGGSLAGFAPGSEPRDALYANDGQGRFRDATAETGLGDREWTSGVRAADVDGDGDPDILLTGFGRDKFYRNAGGRFVEEGARTGLADERWTTGASFFDADADGDLDLFVVRYVAFDRAWVDANAPVRDHRGVNVFFGPRGLPGEPDALYRNDGGRYVDVSHEAGIAGQRRYGFQVVAFDQDQDGRVDLYVANDSQPNHLWRNQGGLRFVEVAEAVGASRSKTGVEQAGMGVALGDANGDGLLDLCVTNFSEDHVTLYEAEAGGFFRDASHRVGLAAPTMASLGWGAGFHDFDLDGDIDLFVANGHVFPQVDRFTLGAGYRQRNQVFENVGGGRFREVPALDGLAVLESSRGAAFGDVDGDGDVDVLVGNLDAPPTLLQNESGRRGDVVRVLVVGSGGNREAVGARVELESGGRLQVRAVAASAGFLSTDEPELCFGLGAAERAERLRVRWPEGALEEHVDLAPGRYVLRAGAIERRP